MGVLLHFAFEFSPIGVPFDISTSFLTTGSLENIIDTCICLGCWQTKGYFWYRNRNFGVLHYSCIIPVDLTYLRVWKENSRRPPFIDTFQQLTFVLSITNYIWLLYYLFLHFFLLFLFYRIHQVLGLSSSFVGINRGSLEGYSLKHKVISQILYRPFFLMLLFRFLGFRLHIYLRL